MRRCGGASTVGLEGVARYSRRFKWDAVELVRSSGRTGSSVAKELGITAKSVRRAEVTVGGGGDVGALLAHGGYPSKRTLALQIGHNRSARGLQYGYLVGQMSKGEKVDYVIVDEAQFLAPEQIDQLARIVDDLDLDVFAFGITTDFRTKLFPGSQRLIELADRIETLQVEAMCWCGARVTHNARTVGGEMVVEGEQVVVGDVNRSPEEVGYEVLCRRHHRRRMTSAAAHAAALSPDVLPVNPA